MSKQFLGDRLFELQLVFVFVFGINQFMQLLTSSEGVSMSWFVAWEVFLLLNLWLAGDAYAKAAPSDRRSERQVFIAYLAWSVMIALDLAVLLFRETWTWSERDTFTAIFVSIGIVATLWWGKFRIRNAYVKGWLAVFFKTVPQVMLAWNIWLMGGGGIAGWAIVAGNVTILARIGQLTLSIRDTKKDKDAQKASLISEGFNLASWALVTVVWLMWRF